MSSQIVSFVGVWTLLIGVGVFFYVLLDGFDLGIGILHGFAAEPDERDLMMRSIAPVWDGNETWLVFCTVALLSAFPLAFAIVFPAIYLPIVVLLIALAFRGVAFEFRFEDLRRRAFWDSAFHWGSVLATFAQGVILGAFIQGYETDGARFTGSVLDCFTLFSVMTGVALLFGYALLGAGWLVIKTDGSLQAWARRVGRRCLLAVIAGIVAVSVWTPLMERRIFDRWFSWPNFVWLSPIPIATAAIAVWGWRSFNRSAEIAPFVSGILLFLLSYAGLAVSLWPMIVPYRVTLWQAAASPSTQAFLLVGALFLLPVILMYSGWSYWVFRGKVRRDVGYH